MKIFNLRRLIGVIVFVLIIFIFINYTYQKYFENDSNSNKSEMKNQNNWQHFTSTKDSFVVDFPNLPTSYSDSVKDEDLSIPFTYHDSKKENKEYIVVTYYLPKSINLKGDENIKNALNVLENSYINSFNGSIIYSKYSSFLGLIALDATSSGKVDGLDYIIQNKIFLTNDNKVFLLSAGSPTNFKPDYLKFINSFRFLQPQ